MDTLRAMWRWMLHTLTAPKPAALPCVMSFPLGHGRRRVVTATAVMRGGVQYTADPYTPAHLLEYAQAALPALDLGLARGDTVQFVFVDDTVVVAVHRRQRGSAKTPGGTTVRVPYMDAAFPRTLDVARPVLHWDGAIAEEPGTLVVHPCWGGSAAVLLVKRDSIDEVA